MRGDKGKENEQLPVTKQIKSDLMKELESQLKASQKEMKKYKRDSINFFDIFSGDNDIPPFRPWVGNFLLVVALIVFSPIIFPVIGIINWRVARYNSKHEKEYEEAKVIYEGKQKTLNSLQNLSESNDDKVKQFQESHEINTVKYNKFLHNLLVLEEVVYDYPIFYKLPHNVAYEDLAHKAIKELLNQKGVIKEIAEEGFINEKLRIHDRVLWVMNRANESIHSESINMDKECLLKVSRLVSLEVENMKEASKLQSR